MGNTVGYIEAAGSASVPPAHPGGFGEGLSPSPMSSPRGPLSVFGGAIRLKELQREYVR